MLRRNRKRPHKNYILDGLLQQKSRKFPESDEQHSFHFQLFYSISFNFNAFSAFALMLEITGLWCYLNTFDHFVNLI